jgi:hypothetical protein
MPKSNIEKRIRFIKRLMDKLIKWVGWEYQEMFDSFIWRCQRFWRGYADIDVWAIDDWMSELMPRMLDHFLDELHGYPSQLKLPHESSLAVDAVFTDEEFSDKRFKHWKAIIAEIKDGFVAWNEMHDKNIYRPEDAKPYIRRFRRGMLLMTKWFDHLWD